MNSVKLKQPVSIYNDPWEVKFNTFKFHETINVDLMRFLPFLFSLFFLFHNRMVSKMVSFVVILASHIKTTTLLN